MDVGSAVEDVLPHSVGQVRVHAIVSAHLLDDCEVLLNGLLSAAQRRDAVTDLVDDVAEHNHP